MGRIIIVKDCPGQKTILRIQSNKLISSLLFTFNEVSDHVNVIVVKGTRLNKRWLFY
jgi:hypothetical protein